MVDIAVFSAPAPAPGGGNASGVGSTSSGSTSSIGATDATRDEAGGAHPFAEILASVGGPSSATDGEESTSPTANDSGDTTQSPSADAESTDALYAMVGLCMAAMPVTPLVVVPAPSASSTSPTEAAVDASVGVSGATSAPPDGAQLSGSTAGLLTDAAIPAPNANTADATSSRDDTATPAPAAGPTATMATPAVTPNATSISTASTSPTAGTSGTTAASTTATPCTTTGGEENAVASAGLSAAVESAATTASDVAARPSAGSDTRALGKGRLRTASTDKASSDAMKVDEVDNASLAAASNASGAVTGATAGGGQGSAGGSDGRTGQEHQRSLTQIAAVAPAATSPKSVLSVSAPVNVASTTDAAATQQAQPWEQVLAVLRPTRRFTDGSHRLSIQMTPDDLGTVTIELSMHRGQLSMHMLTETQGAADALRSSLHELRADLEGSGQRTGSFEVAQQWTQHRQNQSELARAARFTGLDATTSMGSTLAGAAAIDLTGGNAMAGAAGDGRLDLRI